MSPEQEALAQKYVANEADVTTSTQLLRAALKELEAERGRSKAALALGEEAVKLGHKLAVAQRDHAIAVYDELHGWRANETEAPETRSGHETVRALFVEKLGVARDVPPFGVGQYVWTTNLGREHHRTPCHPRDAKQVRVLHIERDAECRGGWRVYTDQGPAFDYAVSYLRAEPPPERWTYEEGQQVDALVGGEWRPATILLHEEWSPEGYSVKWGEKGYAGWVGLDRLRLRADGGAK